MKVICKECGEIFDTDNFECSAKPEYEYIQTEVGNIPYFVGYGNSEDNCPKCGGELVEPRQCECCGEFKVSDKYNWVCDDCVNTFLEKDPLKVAVEMGNYSQSKKKINGFIDYLFTEEKINEILIDYVLKEKDDITEFLADKYARRLGHRRDLDFAILELDEEGKANDGGNK